MANSQTPPPGDILAIRQRQKAEADEKARKSRRDRFDFADGGPGQGSGGVPMKKADTSKTFGGARPETPGSYPAKPKVYGGARPETPGSYQKVRKKTAAQGNTSAPENKATTAATDKSRTAPKMTAFQRQKARQFEEGGYGGRSMTRAQAQRKATEKSSGGVKFSLAGMFGKKSEAPKSAPEKKSPSSEFRKKNLAANQKLGKKK